MPARVVPTRSRVALLALLTAWLLSGCSAFRVTGLSFVTDTRLTITSPQDRSHVTLPLTVRWSVRDFQVVGPAAGPAQGDRAGYFAVFVDGAPPGPGLTLRALFRKDRSCRPQDGCPDRSYLEARQIYTTTDTSLTIEQVPRPAVSTGHERHTATVVLLDPQGRRIGESSFRLVFVLDRKALQ